MDDVPRCKLDREWAQSLVGVRMAVPNNVFIKARNNYVLSAEIVKMWFDTTLEQYFVLIKVYINK